MILFLSDKRPNFAEAGKTKVLFVKNLNYDTTGESLGAAFDESTSARVATHQDSGRSKG